MSLKSDVLKCVVYLLLILAVLTFKGFAAEIEEPDVPQADTVDTWVSEVLDTVDSHKRGNVNVIYSSDSVLQYGVYADSDIDVLNKQVLFVINVDLPSGYTVYDDPETDYIDGIRLNGETVTSYRVPIDYTQDVDFELIVKVVYAEGFTGALAQMSDGTYDWAQLLENPIGLIMALYYILATVSVVAGIFALWKGKSKKVKTSDEISKSVTEAAHNTAVKTIEEQVLPVVTSFQNTAQALVKAFALTTSKSKEAPTALLDVLQNVSNMDAAGAIEQAKELIANNRAADDAARQEVINTLNDIANTSQEERYNGAEQPEQKEDLAIF
jgi:hypothetical protein